MFRLFKLLLILAILPVASDSITHAAPLTKADIPAGLPPNVRLLIEQTFSENIRERVIAARKLGEMHEQAAPAIPFLIRLLGEYDPDDLSGNWYAGDALVSIGEPALDVCIATAKAAAKPQSSDAAWVNRTPIRLLGDFKSPRAVDALLELLKASDAELRRDALNDLGGCTDTRATMPLLEIAQHGQGEMRLSAIGCFRTLRDPRAVEPLLKALDEFVEKPEYARLGFTTSTILALGRQRDRRAVPALLKIMQQPEKAGLHHQTAVALGQISDPAVFQLLVDTLTNRQVHGYVRAGAAFGIAHFRANDGESARDARRDDHILKLLDTILTSDEEPLALRVLVAQAMGESGNPKAVPSLCTIAGSHRNDDLGFWAAVSAVKLTDGDVRNRDVVEVIRNYRLHPEESYDYIRAKHDSLVKLRSVQK